MVLPSDATLRLIQWLAHREPDELAHLATHRNLRVQDLTSLTTLALALNDDASVSQALTSLTRQQLIDIMAVAEGGVPSGTLEPLSMLGLVDSSEHPPQLLCGRTQVAKFSLDETQQQPAPPTTTALSPAEIMRAGTQVETLLCYLDDLLQVIHRGPLPITRDGAPSVSTQKTLVEILGDTFNPVSLVALLQSAGLLIASKTELTLAAGVPQWRLLAREEQWSALATPWWESAPEWLRALALTFPQANWVGDLPALVSYHYPLLGPLGDMTRWVEHAELLGLISKGTPTAWGHALMHAKDTSFLREHLPPSVPGVYAHEDFTLLAPGPLSQEHRSILDRLTHKELGGLVPRYRVTTAALLEALQAGEDPAGIARLLQQTSQNPLPEGMLQLIEDTIRQSENIRLRAAGKGTIVTLRSAQIAQELVADPALVALALSSEQPTVLFTPWPLERVHHALSSARYVSMMELEQGPPSTGGWNAHSTPSPLLEAVHTLAGSIASARSQGIAPWLGSMIEVATEHKIPLEIECEMPGGEIVTLIMEPRSLSNGRLRGLDIKNAMEKTIPVSSIRVITPSTATLEPR